jgi:SSS family solute:Na+ symporter
MQKACWKCRRLLLLRIVTIIALIIALSGWVRYRYRETRAMTMAQFFEMRYSRRFRIFAGIVAWGAGVLNFGIFPGVVARFIVYFCGFPSELHIAGMLVPTIAPVMVVMLSVTIWLILSGGMVTVMIAAFLQALFINIVFIILAFVMFSKFSWSEIAQILSNAPPNHSLLNPFDQASIGDFNVWFFLIFAFKLIYNCLGWQGNQGYNCAAKSPHESRMAGILAEWRGGVSYLMVFLIPICIYVLLHSADRAAEARPVLQILAGISDPKIQSQVTVPLALVQILPGGMVGLFCAAMLASSIGNDMNYLHSWGSIFIQDVILPFRKTNISPEQHLKFLRFSIFGVVAFSFCYSLLFPMRDYIYMYQIITGAVYLGGSGAVIIGGLYWKKGTTAGAWCSLMTGAVIALSGAIFRAINPEFPLNGAWMALIASLSSIAMYIAVSLLTCQEDFNMDQLLHRGEYTIEGDHCKLPHPHPLHWLGINQEFTRGDQFIYFAKIAWTGFWFTAFIAGTVIGLAWGISNEMWAKWWRFTVIVGMAMGLITVVWFLCGGVNDLKDLIKTLRTAKRDPDDNGIIPPMVKRVSIPVASDTPPASK